MKAEDIDKKFDSGEDVLEYFDTDNPLRPNLEAKRVNIDFPAWVVNALDKEANAIGISRQALIKTWIVDRIRHP
ncbi:type II toxin-antitoxin system BrnA family antitoxin [Endozoicomonas sp. SCSIO W0465]|uniref:type II toxin-antitoxin system BrnA family antitoxin n=1 Tax=Endozoicomonas sp. SCSIO W0465 TaxID=2918516 RepID=UPI002074FDFA|nr:BrnA antitoxin family protein [Endozoicomonas sp. SCSIO W0465]USE36342.1 BrnA antitoxin family protein [Endozoicomonas sp. SCSIO W0465]